MGDPNIIGTNLWWPWWFDSYSWTSLWNYQARDCYQLKLIYIFSNLRNLTKRMGVNPVEAHWPRPSTEPWTNLAPFRCLDSSTINTRALVHVHLWCNAPQHNHHGLRFTSKAYTTIESGESSKFLFNLRNWSGIRYLKLRRKKKS